jgi:hypothetical protein
MVRIARTPPPDPPTRTERSVRRNETREAQERERDALAALAAFEIENSTTRIGGFEQIHQASQILVASLFPCRH